MSPQPVHEEPDPRDPQAILNLLPERERDTFLTEYRARAHAVADDVVGYKALQAFLRRWALRARLLDQVLREQPDYYEALDAVAAEARASTTATVPVEAALAETLGLSPAEAAGFWVKKVTAAQRARQNRV